MFLYAPNENDLSLKSRQAGAQRCCAATTKRLLLFLLLVALVGFFRGLGLGFALGALFAFDFFLALLDDFGFGWSCGFRGHGLDRLLFFDLESDNVRENLFGVGQELQLGGVDLQIASAERLIQHQTADIGSKFGGNISRQAFDFDFAGNHFKDAALLLDAGGIAEGVHGNLHAHADVHGDAKEIDMEQFAADGIGEPVLEDGGLVLAVQVDLKESVVATFGAQNGVDLLGVHGERDGLTFAAVEDGGDSAGHTQAASFIFPPRGAGGSFYYYFVLILSHAFYPLCSHWPG